ALAVVWTEAAARGHSLVDVARWMSAAPARLAGLARKGAIAAGRDADLVVFDDAAHREVTAASIHHRHRVTPYVGGTLRGPIVASGWMAGSPGAVGRRLARSIPAPAPAPAPAPTPTRTTGASSGSVSRARSTGSSSTPRSFAATSRRRASCTRPKSTTRWTS